MTIAEATQLIAGVEIYSDAPQAWADLGCGSGVFTKALSNLLNAHSTIHAVDKEHQMLPESHNDVGIIFQRADFIKKKLALSNLDGILMANALHYVQDPSGLLAGLREYTKPHARFIIVEYDSNQSNQWVPYPLPFQKLQRLFASQGFNTIRKVGEKKSRYRQGNIYACVVS